MGHVLLMNIGETSALKTIQQDHTHLQVKFVTSSADKNRNDFHRKVQANSSMLDESHHRQVIPHVVTHPDN